MIGAFTDCLWINVAIIACPWEALFALTIDRAFSKGFIFLWNFSNEEECFQQVNMFTLTFSINYDEVQTLSQHLHALIEQKAEN